MIREISRRAFLGGAAMLPFATGLAASPQTAPSFPRTSRVRLSCNLYSFNKPLQSGQMSLDEVLDFCAGVGFDAVDPTAYYFPSYPELPPDEYVYRIKRKAFRLGLDISGTGVRNDFTLPDGKRRAAEVELVKKWVGCAARFGAPVLRVFSGKGVPPNHTRDEVQGWVIEALRECAAYGAAHGVMIVLQNHADFVQTAADVLRLLRGVNSEWLAVNLDIGSFKLGDPYAEVARLAPYAATWQIKENVFVNGKEVRTDLKKIVQIVRESGYSGYLPIETLGEGDPKIKVPRFFNEVRQALAAPGSPA